MKHADAKVAVCLLAMSQGIGDYIREVGATVLKTISPRLRKITHQLLQPLLSTEIQQKRATITYDFEIDREG